MMFESDMFFWLHYLSFVHIFSMAWWNACVSLLPASTWMRWKCRVSKGRGVEPMWVGCSVYSNAVKGEYNIKQNVPCWRIISTSDISLPSIEQKTGYVSQRSWNKKSSTQTVEIPSPDTSIPAVVSTTNRMLARHKWRFRLGFPINFKTVGMSSWGWLQ